MSNPVIGTLQVYPDEKDSAKKVSYNLRAGEHIIGTHKTCDVILSFPNIAAKHCKLTISNDGGHKIEDLNTQHGVFRVTPSNPRQKLRANTKYDLVQDVPFYIANKYKCVFEPMTGDDGKQ